MQSHLFVKVLAKKPGWKDSNFQVEPPQVLEVLSAGLSPSSSLPLTPLLLLTLLLLLHSLSSSPILGDEGKTWHCGSSCRESWYIWEALHELCHASISGETCRRKGVVRCWNHQPCSQAFSVSSFPSQDLEW